MSDYAFQHHFTQARPKNIVYSLPRRKVNILDDVSPVYEGRIYKNIRVNDRLVIQDAFDNQ